MALGTLVSGLGSANGEPPSPLGSSASPLLFIGGPALDPEDRPQTPGQALVSVCTALQAHLLDAGNNTSSSGDGGDWEGSGRLGAQALAAVTLLQRACGHRTQARRLLAAGVAHTPQPDAEAFTSLLLPLAAAGLTADLRALQSATATWALEHHQQQQQQQQQQPSTAARGGGAVAWPGCALATGGLATAAARNDSAGVASVWRQMGALAATGSFPPPSAATPLLALALRLPAGGSHHPSATTGGTTDAETCALPLHALAHALGCTALNAPAACSSPAAAAAAAPRATRAAAAPPTAASSSTTPSCAHSVAKGTLG
jgi:hypothetical protein